MAVRFAAGSDVYTSSAVPTSPWTAAVWVQLRAGSTTDYYQTLFGAFNGTGTYRYLATAAGGTSLTFFGQSSNATGASLTRGTWYKTAVVVSGSTVTLYWAPEGTATLSSAAGTCGTSSVTTFLVGDSSFANEFLDGSLAALKVWSAALTKTELEAEFTQQAPIRTSGLYRYHQFLTAPGTADTSGNGRTFTAGTTATATSSGPSIPDGSGTTYSRTGGAAGRSAGGGSAEVFVPNYVDRTGSAAGRCAGSGAKTLVNIPPDLLPSDVLDLSYWHLTTPEDEGDGTAEQIDQPALDSYETSNFFADTVDGQPCVVFRAPVDGFSTSAASGATRMELRQHRKSGYANAAMDPNGSGRWQMTITTSADPTTVTGGSNPRQELIIAQIHGAGSTPIPLILSAEWTSGGNPVTPRVRVFKNGPVDPVNPIIISNITTSTRLTFRIRIDADAGRLKLWGVAGEVTDLAPLSSPQYDWPISDFTDQEGWYFKDGSYHKTTITSGSSGAGIAKVTYLNILEPSDPEEVFSVVYELAGGSAATAAGSGAQDLVSALVHTRTGAASAVAAGSGAAEPDPAATYDRTGSAALVAAGSGTRELSLTTAYALTGGSSVIAAGSVAREIVPATTYDEVGGVAVGAAGSGSVDLAHATTYDRTGGAAGAAAGSGAKTHTSIIVYVRTGGAATSVAGGGVLQTGGGIEYARTGGTGTSVAGSGTRAIQSADVQVRAGGASTSVAGSGAQSVQGRVIHTRTGGASAAAASTGLAELVPAARHDHTGGAAASPAATGTSELTASVVHAKTGGAATSGAGVGVASIVGATVHVRTGGAAARSSGIGLVEIIGPAVYDQTGGGVAVLVGSGRSRVGGRMRAAVPVAIGQFRAGTPVRR